MGYHGKKLFYRTGRFTQMEDRAGYITMDQAGERYAVWAELKDTTNTEDLPVVFAGDFNSNRSRSNDAPRIRFAQSKWYDAYDRSATYTNPNYNSYNGWLTTVTKSVKYGGHVDKIFISDAMGSTTWRVVNKLVSGKYVTPMASDHNPIRATLYLP